MMQYQTCPKCSVRANLVLTSNPVQYPLPNGGSTHDYSQHVQAWADHHATHVNKELRS